METSDVASSRTGESIKVLYISTKERREGTRDKEVCMNREGVE